MTKQHLTGLIAAVYTAMHPDGSLNLDLIPQQAHSLIASGTSGAFVCGTTGESASLTLDERRRVAECWAALDQRELAIVVHVGHNCLADCQALAAHAQSIGARAIATVAPSYFKPARLEDLVSFCAAIAAAAPGLPFYYYHIPSMTGVNFPVAEFLQMAAPRIPNLAGAKFTFEDLADLERCLRLNPADPFDILFGRDEMLLSALKLGVRGAVGSTYNFMAPRYIEIMRLMEKGDLAAAEAGQATATALINIMIRHGGMRAGKAMMKLIGLDCGPVRLPLSSLSDQEFTALRAQLEQAGFFECTSKVD
jgi:N-acetylneuraminate lyase